METDETNACAQLPRAEAIARLNDRLRKEMPTISLGASR